MGNRWGVAAILFVGTAIAYAGLLGWDRTYQTDPVTQEVSGPYEAWQVLLLGAVVVGLTVWASWKGHFLTALWAIPLALVVAFVIVAVLIMVGAILMAIGSVIGVAVLGGLTLAARGAMGGRAGAVENGQ